MKYLLVLLLVILSTAATAQTCQLPAEISSAKGFAIDVKPQELKNGYTRYVITFKTPATSNHVLESSVIACEGWMPKGADIRRIEVHGVTGVQAYATDVKWKCNTDDCTWKGGQTGCVVVILKQLKKGATIPAEVQIKGLGSLYGISKWYDCKLELKL